MPGPLQPLVPGTPCQTWSGVFFVRRCGRPAVARCRRCGKAVCEEHLRPAPAEGTPSYLCLDCFRPARAGERASSGESGASSDSSRPSAASAEPGWSGAGGTSGGGGSSGGWGAPAAGLATLAGGAAAEGAEGAEGIAGLGADATGEPVFTEADYAAFAAMSDADKDEGGSSYDS